MPAWPSPTCFPTPTCPPPWSISPSTPSSNWPSLPSWAESWFATTTSPRQAGLSLVLLTALAFVLAASLNKWTIPTQFSPLDTIYLVLMQLFAVLRVVFLLTLVWWSSLQGLRWPTRELRIVTGLGVYIIATLSVAILHSHNMAGMQIPLARPVAGRHLSMDAFILDPRFYN